MGMEPVADRLNEVLRQASTTGGLVTGHQLATAVADYLAEWAGRRSRHWGSDSTLREVVALLHGEPWTQHVLALLPEPSNGLPVAPLGHADDPAEHAN